MIYAESVVTFRLRLEKKDVMYVKAQTFNSWTQEGTRKILTQKVGFFIDVTIVIQI